MAYGYGAVGDAATAIYRQLMAGSYGAQDPYTSPYSSTTFQGPTQDTGSMLVDLVLRNTLGVRNLFTLPKWDESAAGQLGAYGYSRFRANQEAFAVTNRLGVVGARGALGQVFAGNSAIRRLTGMDDAAAENLVRKFETGDSGGFTDMFVNFAKQAFNVEDYGYTGTHAARQRSAFLLAGMSPSANRLLSDINPISDNWTAREASVVGNFARNARNAMYEEGFLRDENFMRGFRETDVAPLLERVAATAGGGENMGDRIKKVGGAAIKTLEAYRDLFGNAEEAKRVLNQMTAGGWSNMTTETLDRLTNQARGLMRLGEINGIGPQAVAGAMGSSQAGVRAAFGYSPSDVSGGYVSNGAVAGIANRFLAQQLADQRVLGGSLDPIEMQRLQARSTWRATQFAGSSAGQGMIAFQYALKTGAISGTQAEELRRMFESGDTTAMGRARTMTAQALGIDVGKLHDTAFQKMALAAIENDAERIDDLANMGARSSENEDRTLAERAYAEQMLDTAKRNARAGGAERLALDETTKRAQVRAVKDFLRQNEGSADASRALQLLEAAERNAGADTDKLMRGMGEILGSMENQGAADVARTRATLAAAESINTEAYGQSVGGVSDTVLRMVTDRGGTLNDGQLSRVDAMKLLNVLNGSSLLTDAQRKAVDTARQSGSTEQQIVDAFNAVGSDLLGMAARQTAFNRPQTQSDLSTTRLFGSDIAQLAAGEGGVKVETLWTTGGTGTTTNFEDVRGAVDTAFGGIDAQVNELARKVEAEYDAKKKAIDEDKSLKPEEKAQKLAALEKEYAPKRADIKAYRDAKSTFDSTATSDLGTNADARKNWREAAGKAAAAASRIEGFDAETLNNDFQALEGFGDSDAMSFLKALSASNGEGTDVTIGGRHVRRAEFDSVAEQAAQGIQALEGKSGLELYKALQEDDSARRAWAKRMQDKGLDVSAVFDSNANLESATGGVAMSNVIGMFGGEVVAGDVASRALRNAGEKAGMTTESIEKIGATVQGIVDQNAASAYVDAGQAVLRGLQKNDWDKAYEVFLRKDATQGEKAAFISKIQGLFSSFIGEDGELKEGKTAEDLQNAAYESQNEVREAARAAKGSDGSEASEAARKAVAANEKMGTEDNPFWCVVKNTVTMREETSSVG